jgi:hypothetical protein
VCFHFCFENLNGLVNVIRRLGIKLSSNMLNVWDYHCSGGEYKDPQGKPFKHKYLFCFMEISRLV